MEYAETRLQTSARRGVGMRLPFKRHAPTRHAVLSANGASQCVSLRSISRHGVRLDRAFGLQPGDTVDVRLPSQQPLNGTVDWSVAGFCGIRFDQPLADGDPALAGA